MTDAVRHLDTGLRWYDGLSLRRKHVLRLVEGARDFNHAHAFSAGVKQAQLSGGAFAGKLVEMPMGHAAVHELREADNIGAHP